ncbi:MAG: pirin family protein [Anaerococcus sp.]|nr:pirin family protein [Anaerococcus sp.]
MTQRTVEEQVQGYRTQDGAGVSLVRVLSNRSTDIYDPFLMLDSFDTTDYDSVRAGFPFHPHRGIETISYLKRGKMTHRDSLGNEDTIGDGEVQWMTAGSGILHEETIPYSDRMLGTQLWLNLPRKDKMVQPKYHPIKNEDIKEIEIEGGKLRLLAGSYLDNEGYKADYLPMDYYDIELAKDKEFTIETDPERSITVFTLLGSIEIDGLKVPEKTAAKLSKGDTLTMKALEDDTSILFMSSKKLEEPIAWGGPIVMNSREELYQAFSELETGNFIKDEIDFEAEE